MKNPIVELRYSLDKAVIKSQQPETDDYKIEFEVTDCSIKASVVAKKEIDLHDFAMIFEHKYPDGIKVFSNGYQSWTTSREYVKSDKMRDITPIAFNKSLRELAGVCSDVRFVDAPKVAGEFTSHAYTYTKDADAKLYLIGSLNEKNAFTVFYHNMNKNTLKIDVDIEGFTLKEGEKFELVNSVIFEGEYDEVFDKYFEALALPKPRIDHMSGYTSWYNYFQNINEEIILRDLDALDDMKDSVSIFQVDDGYEPFVGDWLDENLKDFPHGMRYISDKIHEKGYLAGLWIGPFSVEKKSKTFKEHQDWLIKDEKGKPVFSVYAWSGAYTLDIYNNEAREYMRKVLQTAIKDWNFDMVKLDFLYSQCMFPRNGKTRAQIMDDAMAFVREACEDKLILGCGVPLASSFGYVDACRISCDVDLKYSGKIFNKLNIANELPCAQNAITNSIFRRHLDGRAFCNDPDVLFLRDTNLEFNDEQRLLVATINHLFGNVLFVSDNVSEYRDEYKKLIKKVFEKSDFKIVSADFIDKENIKIIMSKNGKEKMLRFNLKTGKNNLKMEN